MNLDRVSLVIIFCLMGKVLDNLQSYFIIINKCARAALRDHRQIIMHYDMEVLKVTASWPGRVSGEPQHPGAWQPGTRQRRSLLGKKASLISSAGSCRRRLVSLL